MADVVLCVNSDCQVKDNCYRYCAKPGILSSYLDFSYKCNKDSGFENFIKIRRNEE